MLPGDGCVPRMSRPSARASISTRVMTWISVADVAGRVARARQQVLGAHDLGNLPEHGAAAQIDQPIGDAAQRRDSTRGRTCSPIRRT